MADPKKIIIQGVEFTASQPYEAGHTLTESEARALNQVRSENLRNNFAARVKATNEGKEGADTLEALQSAFAQYDAEYSFAMPGAGGGSTRRLDPIEREARALAKEIIKNELLKVGRKLSDIPQGLTKEEWAEKLELNIDRVATQDTVLKVARSNVERRSKLVESAGLDIGL